MKEVGLIWSTNTARAAPEAERKTLRDLRFQTGDFIDCAIHFPKINGPGGQYVGPLGPARAAGVARRGRVVSYLVVLRGLELAFEGLAAMAWRPYTVTARERAAGRFFRQPRLPAAGGRPGCLF